MSTGEDGVLLALSLVCYGLVAWTLLRQAGGFIMTPALLFFLLFTVLIYIIGLNLFITNGAGALWSSGERNFTFYLALNGGMLSMAAGVLAASGIAHFRPRSELLRFRSRPWQETHTMPGDHLFLGLMTVAALAITLAFVFFIKGGGIPLLTVLLAKGSINIQDLASASRAEFSRYGIGAGQYAYQGYIQQFYGVILPVISLLVGARYLHNRRARLLLTWIGLTSVTGFFLVMSLQRWPLMFFIMLNFLLVAGFHGRIRLAHALGFLVLVLGIFTGITYIRGLSTLSSLYIVVVDRIFFILPDIFYSMFEMFPRHFPFWGGQALWGDVAGLLPGPDPGFARWMFDHVYRVSGNGTAPTLFWGQLYADFGLSGVWVGALLSGIAMQAIYIRFIRGRKTLVGLVIFVVFSMAMGQLAMTNPVVVLFQFGIVTMLLMLLLMNVMRWLLNAAPFPSRDAGSGIVPARQADANDQY